MDVEPPDPVDPSPKPNRPTVDEQQTARLREKYLGRGQASPLALAAGGIELASAVVILTLLGWWLDSRWGTSPWIMLVGMVIGAVGGMYRLWRQGRRFFKK